MSEVGKVLTVVAEVLAGRRGRQLHFVEKAFLSSLVPWENSK